jgi:hypothetical protein
MGIFWYANRELRELQLEAKEQELVRRAEVVVAEYRSLMDHTEAFIQGLAEFPEIRTARFPDCNQYLERILEHTDHYTTITVIGMDGYQACGALTPGSALYLGDRAYFTRATSRGQFSAGEFALGRITGKPMVGLAIPVFDGEEMSGVFGASLDLNVLGTWEHEGPMPEGYTFSVLDRNKRVMVRLPHAGDFTLADSVGAIADENFPAPPEGSGVSIIHGIDLDGMERLFAVAALPSPAGGSPGYIAFGRTRITLMEEVDAIVSLQLRFLAVGGIVLLALAWALGHFFLARCPPGSGEESTAA